MVHLVQKVGKVEPSKFMLMKIKRTFSLVSIGT